MNTNKNDLITIEQLCNSLQIGRNKAYDLIRDGQIEAFQIGRRWKIPQSSLDNYIEQMKSKK